MHRNILLIILSVFSISSLTSQEDWDGVSVPITLENGDSWVLQTNVSDGFNYSAPADNKGTTFKSKWDDFYHNGWTGPATTVWTRKHSTVEDGELKLTATRYQTDKVNAGAIHSNATVQYPVYIEARIKIMNSVLANGAWLLSPDDTQEIDFMEGYGATYSESADSDLTWWAKRMHVSHHVFIRSPLKDWQPNELSSGPGNPSKNPTWITSANTIWKDDYHTYGVYWKDPWHLYYYIDGVEVSKREGKDEVDPLYYTNSVDQGNTSNDTRTGLSKAMDVLITVEEQGWRSAAGKSVIPTDNELANTDNHTLKVDWIRAYQPKSSLSVNSIKNNLKVDVFPNPSFDFVKVNSSKLIGNIDCFDMVGNLISSQKYDDASVTFNVENLSNGIYFLQILAEDGAVSRHKILKY
ncbi:T9SS type A sorting domain-containing protein [Polaribacter staleyi]|uniref:T9SS type A sorting domain-containing protein n=1 Tax=Polaribacter staleyi TaxID=2022337 RepID=UPI0031BA3908